jgi:MtN3 and saliva related transmembrane protein
MFTVRAIGLVLWFVYGYGVGSLPVLVFSALSLGLSIAILALKVRHTRRVRQAEA